MRILYSDEPAFAEKGLSIFLAGPTPRGEECRSWRPDAVEFLTRNGFDGTVLLPERKDWLAGFDYTSQTEWEFVGLSHCTVIAFWVAREMNSMPALTTNVEFGYWLASAAHKVVYGRPDSAASIRYLDWLFRKIAGREPFGSLEDTLLNAIKLARLLNQV